ncbi:MAG: hypothetical protein IPN03_19200 [Holophagales bacterium]|nr:hypothetical protein [Holophagales bacterium]
MALPFVVVEGGENENRPSLARGPVGLPSFGWLRWGRHIRKPASFPDSSCESAEELHMLIDMRMDGRMTRADESAAAPDGAP